MPLSTNRKLACRLAAFLHDLDNPDRMPTTKAAAQQLFSNALGIAKSAGAPQCVLDDVLKMMGWVACRHNGNRCPAEAREHPELLWPRWADRLQSAGEAGVARCFIYHVSQGLPLSLDSTPRAQTPAQALAFATRERFDAFCQRGGNSASMMDFYYDKLLRMAWPDPRVVKNTFLQVSTQPRPQRIGLSHRPVARLLRHHQRVCVRARGFVFWAAGLCYDGIGIRRPRLSRVPHRC